MLQRPFLKITKFLSHTDITPRPSIGCETPFMLRLKSNKMLVKLENTLQPSLGTEHRQSAGEKSNTVHSDPHRQFSASVLSWLYLSSTQSGTSQIYFQAFADA
eukprot:jgi/Botrbrau1/5670/Bobra.0071s0012.1